MATNENAMTIADIAIRLDKSDIAKKVAYSLYETDWVCKDMVLKTNPLIEMGGMRVRGSDLPDTDWVSLNEEPPIVKGSQEPFKEPMFLIRNRIRIDYLLRKQPTMTDPVDDEFQKWKRGFVYDTNDSFFNGNPQRNGKEWRGLKYRLTDGSLETDMTIDANGTKITPDATKADSIAFLSQIRRIFARMNAPGGEGVTLYINDETEIAFWAAVANAGAAAGFSTDKDSFDRDVQMFGKAKIRVIGRKRNQIGRIIPIDEDATGVSATNGDGQTLARTSIYAVKHGEGYFSGWQTNVLKPRVIGAGPDDRDTDWGIFQQILMEWGCGFWVPDTRCICRLKNLRLGA